MLAELLVSRPNPLLLEKAMRTILSAAVIGLLATTAPAIAGDEAAGGEAQTWADSFDKAVETAKSQNKPMLVDFTGSDW
jgi:hypothetical protein